MGTSINTTAFIERLRKAWQDRSVQRKRQAETDARARCMKCHADFADGKTTEAESECWLRQHGEPALANATRDRQLTEGHHHDAIEPILLEFRRGNAARKRAALAELKQANDDDIAIETAWRGAAPRDLQRSVSSMVMDLDVWMANEDRRIERALMPAVTMQPPPPQKPAPRPDYEPLIAIVAAAADC